MVRVTPCEELVAEMGGRFFMCLSRHYTRNPGRPPAYIASWLEVLKGDKRAIFTAASKASQAAEYLQSLAMPQQVAA